MKKIATILFVILTTISGYATTWDEPWQKEIIEKSDYFVYGTVINASDSLVIVEIDKSFGNLEIAKIITIDNFFMLHLCSMSGGHGPEFIFKKGEKGYFFLKKGNNGNFQIPTPTSGFDRIVGNKVYATYRHTYHQAAISPKLYEFTYKEIWNKFHKGKFEKEKILKFINEQVSKNSAGFEDKEIELFFKQHVALETAYLLGIKIDFNILKKFSESNNFHSQISALRAMGNLNNNEVKKYLIDYLKDKNKDNFTKVIAIWSLWKIKDSEVKKQLSELKEHLSDEEIGFERNIMDPRVCTHFPSPKSAIIELENQE